MPEFAPGDVFVNHRIEGLAGRGGMGVVYRATDLDLDRVVALKVIAPALADDPDFRARFVAESKAAASIEHPHVIPLYYAGERGGVLFIVMRYVDGPDLRALVRAQGSLDPERAALIVSQIGGALDAAHAHGLVHRDVKPANVLLGEGEHAYLTDFGLTKREASTGGVSRAGGWVGTLGFVAPEQIRGERVDARTDVYALGCVLVHALSGGAPYLRDSDEATLWAHLNAPPPTDRVPPEFAAVVERALSKDPADRYPSAGDLGRAALAAAGRSGATGPERNVARGEAAPEGTPQTLPTARASLPSHEGETRASPDPGVGPGLGETAVTGRLAGSGGLGGIARRPLLLLGALVVVAGVLAALLLSGGGGKPASADRTTTAPAPASGASKVDPQIAIAT
ncbi:MAG TPA: serine/threonine-protein kinase, partial [Solirubrobacteraceae bacterium]